MSERHRFRELGDRIDKRAVLTVTLGAAAGFLAVEGSMRLLERMRARERTAARGPAYRRLEWQTTVHNPDRIEWAVIMADKDPVRGSGPPQPKIGILTSPRATVDEFRERWDGVDAVAYLDAHNLVHVGAAPDDTPLFVPDPIDSAQYAVGLQVGDTNLITAIGIWAPDRGAFLNYHMEVHEQATTPDTIAQDLPGVSYVVPA